MILKTRQGRYRVKVKDHGLIVADRTFARWNEAQAWEADRKRQVAPCFPETPRSFIGKKHVQVAGRDSMVAQP